jgi:Abnormal spindle-like microcephaly-assoc'd, ASPM-SPD-2-Hydin
MRVRFPQSLQPWVPALVLVLCLVFPNFSSAQTATSQQLKCNPCSLSFGSVAVGTSKKMWLTLTNKGSSSLTINGYNIKAAGFHVTLPVPPVTLAPSEFKTMAIVFKPTATGSVSGSIYVLNNKSSVGLLISVSGTGTTSGGISPNPSSISYGTVTVGSSTTQTASIKNTGTTSIQLKSSSITGAGFSFSGLTLPMTLSGGQSVTFTTKFAPTVTGSVSGSITVTSSLNNAVVKLSGTGGTSGSLSASPSTLNFGTVTVGTTKSMTGAITAGTSGVTVSSGASSTSEFVLSGLSFPFSLSAGQSKSYTVTFKPQSSGTATASLKFTTGSGATVSESLTGSGAAASSHSVSLNWVASTSSTVVGYNVYRGTTSGGPYSRVNSALESSTNFVDGSVLAGKTYFYVVTAVSGSGSQSGFSNQVKAIIPSP